MLYEVGPARIGLDPRISGLRVEITPCCVQRGNARIASPREVEHGQIERGAEQIIAQRFGDKLVDLVAGFTRDAADDGACCLLRSRTARGEGQWIEEGRDQAQLLIVCWVEWIADDGIEVGVETVNRL